MAFPPQAAGNTLAIAVQKGTGFVRLFFLVVVAVTIVRLGFTTYAAP